MLLCKKCYGEFDLEVELLWVLLGNEEVFWICIFVNDIGVLLKFGRDKVLYLEVEMVSWWLIEDFLVCYGYISEFIGCVLFGWYIYWDDKFIFVCVLFFIIKKVLFEVVVLFFLIVVC